MVTHMANSDGSISEQEICYYAARAKGGVGLIITGIFITSRHAWEQQVIRAGALFDRGIHLYGACELTETIHHFGSKVFIQLSPGLGRQQGYTRSPLYSASAGIPLDKDLIRQNRPESNLPFLSVAPKFNSGFSAVPEETTVAEIKQDIRDYLEAVDLAVVGGFDGIEIHSPHGYLLHQFLSPRTNKRTDEYGGSPQNRFRFLSEIISGIRREFGPHLPVSVRLSSAEHVPGGYTPEDMREFALMCEQAGADVIHLSDGCREAYRYFFPSRRIPISLRAGPQLKAVVNIPLSHSAFTTLILLKSHC
jgi:2,4-dienoyl-CoA reductase-like NADH-dependent reductase (Old Yellow Enzyme family)